MARDKLTARGLPALSAPGKHEDGGGLRLVKGKDKGAGKWVLRVSVHGRRPEMGLGPWPAVSLADARKEADKWRAVAASGRDPLLERERQRRAGPSTDTTLAKLTEAAFEARKAQLKGDGEAGRWLSPLKVHVLPKLGAVPVQEIDRHAVRDVLAPIWYDKPEAARKAVQRIQIVLEHAAAQGLDVDLQAVAHAKALLGQQRHTPKHIEAMPWRAVPAFYRSLTDATPCQLALRLLILTGQRSAPVRRLHVDHIDGDVWTVPADLMNGTQGRTAPFRVPLCGEALAVVEAAKPLARDGYLFPGARKGVISVNTMSKHMRTRGLDARPHGFRSSLRDWLAEATQAPHEVAETMLAHKVGSAVTRAYRRTDFLDERRALHAQWADFLLTS